MPDYFISYHVKLLDDDAEGFGNCVISSSKPIRSLLDINVMQYDIKKANKWGNDNPVVIISFQKLEG